MSLDYSEINIKYDDYNLVCYDSGVNKNEMGTLEGDSGNWTFEIALSGDSYVRMRIAGAIQYTYAV